MRITSVLLVLLWTLSNPLSAFSQFTFDEMPYNYYTYAMQDNEGHPYLCVFLFGENTQQFEGKEYHTLEIDYPRGSKKMHHEFALPMLRKEQDKIFWLDTKTNTEHLIYDFALAIGDRFFNTIDGTEYQVVDVRDTTFSYNDQKNTLIELASTNGGKGHDIWMKDLGSLTYGILRPGMLDGIKDFRLESAEDANYRYFPISCKLNTGYMKIAEEAEYETIQWDSKKAEQMGHEKYLDWLYTKERNAEFIDDTLHVWGRETLNCAKGGWVCAIDGNAITLINYLGSLMTTCNSVYNIDLHFPGFAPGTYTFEGKEIVCKGKAEEDKDYLPFVVEGKVWNIEKTKRWGYWPEGYYDDTVTHKRCELKGDVEINGKVYKKYYEDGQHVGNLREEHKRVYRYINNHDVLLYDFGMQEGDAIENYGLEYVLAHRDEFESCGNTLHRMEVVSQEHFGYDYPKSVANYWIEGIGALEGPLAPFYAEMDGGTEIILVSCYIGDKCIYRKEDYPDGAPDSSIAHILPEFANESRIYQWAMLEGTTIYPTQYMPSRFYERLSTKNQEKYALLIPTDNALTKYVDAASLGKVQKMAVSLTWREAAFPIATTNYRYDAATGTIGSKITGEKASLSIAATTKFLDMMLKSHTIPLTRPEDAEKGLASGNNYFQAMDGSVIKVHVDEKGYLQEVQGGLQLQNEQAGLNDFAHCYVYNEWRSKNFYLYELEKPVVHTPNNVLQVLQGEEGARPFAAFYELTCVDQECLAACGFSDIEDLLPYRKSLEERLNYTDDEPFTLFVPTNEAIEEEITAGLPTWESIHAHMEAHTTADKDGRRAWDSEGNRLAVARECLTLINFLKAHIMKGVEIADQLPFSRTHSTALKLSTGKEAQLLISSTGSEQMSIDDGKHVRTVLESKNIFTVDKIRNYPDNQPISINSDMVTAYIPGIVHQIDGVLRYDHGDMSLLPTSPANLCTFEEGRTWCVGHCSFWPIYGEILAQDTYTVTGKKEINEIMYYAIKIWHIYPEGKEEGKTIFMRESDGKIYRLDSQGEVLVFDCNMKVGEKNQQGYRLNQIVEDEDSRRHFYFQYGDEPDLKQEYIEGIGYTDGSHFHSPLNTTGSFEKLICCHAINGDCYYGEPGHSCAFAQSGEAEEDNDYLPFVVEGKVWNVELKTIWESWPDYGQIRTCTFELRGDTLIGNTYYKKFYRDGEYWGALREENKQVFFCWRSLHEERLFYDFSLMKGETFEYQHDMRYILTRIDKFESCGNSLKRLELTDEQYDGDINYWIEGIGSIEGPETPIYSGLTGAGAVQATLASCYIGDKCIYRKEDYPDSEPENGIWMAGSQWEVHYEDGETVTYRLTEGTDVYLALEKKIADTSGGGQTEATELQGYLRYASNTNRVYVRPVLDDGTIGEEYLLYDFSMKYEYGQTIRYGLEGGEVVSEYIDWQTDSLDYYVLDGEQQRCLPCWKGIVYLYGYLGGPMELFNRKAAPGKNPKPKPTNISHVIFSTKGGTKGLRIDAEKDGHEVIIPYDEMLTPGTTWECLAVSTLQPSDRQTYTIEVEGETLVSDRLCKQIHSPELDTRMTVFEEGRKLYAVNTDNTPEVLIDFGLQEKERLDEVKSVLSIGTQNNQGINYRIITIDTGMECNSYYEGDTTPWDYTLIEGIGASKDEFLPGPHLLPREHTISYLLRCWKDGKLVYQAPGYNAIGKIATDTTHPIYDLQGRQLQQKPSKGMYIQGGKKVVIK